MSIDVTGEYKQIMRQETGFYSLDRAFINLRGDLGIPIGHGIELFGSTHVGKSTFAYSLSGLLSKAGIALCDFEGFDITFLLDVLNTSGYSGTLNILSGKTDEDQLLNITDTLSTDECDVAILDSIGSISPISEAEGELGEANMGRRAFLMAQFTRKLLKIFRDSKKPKTMIMTNHWYPKIGSRGYESPGGKVKEYITSIRILLKRAEEFPDGSYVLEGKVYKNRWGYKGKMFYVFMLGGKGLHKGMSALYDGTLLNLVERKKVIKIGDESFGYIKNIIMEHAHTGDDEFFVPFIELLEKRNGDKNTGGSNQDNKSDESEIVED